LARCASPQSPRTYAGLRSWSLDRHSNDNKSPTRKVSPITFFGVGDPARVQCQSGYGVSYWKHLARFAASSSRPARSRAGSPSGGWPSGGAAEAPDKGVEPLGGPLSRFVSARRFMVIRCLVAWNGEHGVADDGRETTAWKFSLVQCWSIRNASSRLSSRN